MLLGQAALIFVPSSYLLHAANMLTLFPWIL